MKDLTQKAYTGLAQFVIALFVFLFLPAWSLDFWQAWIYWFIFSLCVLIITVYFLQKDPKLVERRLSVGPGSETEKSQKIIQSITGFLFIALMIFASIDHRFALSTVPSAIVIVGDLLTIIGFVIIFFVFKENSFTAATITTDKNQTVISTGPYSIVRNPMYSGAVFLFVGTPLALGSYWDLMIGVLLCIMLCIRLIEEEKFLRKNLKGYTDYCRKVRYHLVPYFW